ncbi:phage shock envelope stress response protein PspM [Parasphingorhabdus pacifica]
MRPRKNELAELGDTALRQLRGPVLTGVRKRIARWRDPRERLLRRRKRAKQGTVAGATATGTFGAGSAVSFSPSLLGIQDPAALGAALDLGGFALGTVAVASGAATIAGAVKYRRLKRTPLPAAAPEPVELPVRGSAAFEPMRRLRDAEQSLHEVLGQLSSTGAGGEAASDARSAADGIASALREVATKVTAVEAVVPHSPVADRGQLEAEVVRLRSELDEGVDGYGGLVAAAGRAVAATSAPEQKHLMQDATDRLAGLAKALHEVSGANAPESLPEAPEESPQERDVGGNRI